MTLLSKSLALKMLCILFVLLCSFSGHSQSWIQVTDFPSTERDDGISFVIDNTAYCGTGYKVGWTETKDFYAFSMNTDTWSAIAALPDGNERQYASGFASATHGFVFGGVKGGTFLNDLWQYDPETNSWLQKTSLPAIGRSGSASFVIDNVAYIIGGKSNTSDAISEVWAYDMMNDTWQQKNDFPFGSRFRASASANDDTGYLIFGKDENNLFYNNLYKYNPITDLWTAISEFPNSGRSHSTLSSVNNNLIVIGGIDSTANYYGDMWQYNLDLGWIQLESLPSFGRKGGMCFNNGTNIYYTTGINQEDIRLKETWKSVNPTALKNVLAKNGIAIYPNPASEKLTLEIRNFVSTENSIFSIFDYLGRQIRIEPISTSQTTIDISDLSKGVYIIQIPHSGRPISMKFLKE